MEERHCEYDKNLETEIYFWRISENRQLPNKIKKVLEYNKKGSNIKIISESEFLEMLKK